MNHFNGVASIIVTCFLSILLLSISFLLKTINVLHIYITWPASVDKSFQRSCFYYCYLFSFDSFIVHFFSIKNNECLANIYHVACLCGMHAWYL